MRTLVADGEVVSAQGVARRDILIEDGQIAAVGVDLSHRAVDELIDASGLHVFPGFIDPHVHARDPGFTDKETWLLCSQAAAAGGITTVFQMPNTVPPVTSADVVIDRSTHHERVAHVDFGLWGLVFGNETRDELVSLRRSGVVAAKLFWGYAFDTTAETLVYDAGARGEGFIEPATLGAVWSLLQGAAEAELLVGVHCEDPSILTSARETIAEVRDYEDLLRTRPECAETVAVSALIELAAASGARVHVLHLSCQRSAELVRNARRSGIHVTAESCPHYLTLTADDYELVGAALKVFPPVRRRENRDHLWAAVTDGTITSVGSDHAPHAPKDRAVEFGIQPAGVTGIETLVPVMLDCVVRGLLSRERLAWLMSEGTARLYGLFPRKGSISKGADGDLTLVDFSRQWTIDNDRLHSKHPMSPWHGATGTGSPVAAVLRGRTIMKDREPVGPATGQWIRPIPAIHSLSDQVGEVSRG